MPDSIYDLMLLLQTSVEEDRRLQIRADVEQAIADHSGRLELAQDWGVRKLAYEIDDIADAEYQLVQFSGPPALVETLSHNLKIADGVLRHRIIKLAPGVPEAVDPPAGITAAPAAEPAEPAA